MTQSSESGRVEVNRRWKIFGTCAHLIWSYSVDQPYEVDDSIWCGPCNDYTSVESINESQP